MQYGPQAALIAESFPTRLRYSGAGLGYQLASVFAGGPAPLLATWLLHTFDSSTLPIALYIMRRGVVTLIATALLPEPNRATVAREFEEGATAPAPEPVGRRRRGGPRPPSASDSAGAPNGPAPQLRLRVRPRPRTSG